MVDVAVVVVSWNVRDLLARCLDSVQASLADSGLSWQLVVVDNASTDGTRDVIRRDFGETALFVLPQNRGFAAANNVALGAMGLGGALSPVPASAQSRALGTGKCPVPLARPRFVLLLNPDTEVDGAAIPQLVSYLEAHADVGVVGPQLRFADGSVQGSRRRWPSLGTLFWESTPLEQCWPGNPWARRYHVRDRADDVEQEVDWLVGACLLVRTEAIEGAGPLDEGYFLYFEEMEWCRRLREAGWRVVYLPAARVLHHEGRSSEQVPLQRHLLFQRSKLRYARESFGPAVAGLLRWFLLAMYGWQFLLEAAKWLLGHKRALRRERIRVYGAVLRSGLRGER